MKIRKSISILLAFAMTLGMLTLGAARDARADGEWTDIADSAELLEKMDSANTYTGNQFYRLASDITSNASGSSNAFNATTDDIIVIDALHVRSINHCVTVNVSPGRNLPVVFF